MQEFLHLLLVTPPLAADGGATPGLFVVSATGLNSFLLVVSDASHGSGPMFQAPCALDIRVVQSTKAVVTDTGLDALVQVDLSTGNRVIISDATTGLGPKMNNPLAIVCWARGSSSPY
jgi:hypothetical protein